MRDKPDTAEFIVPEVGYQKAQNFVKEQATRIEKLEEGLRYLARKIHTSQHSPLTSMAECNWSSCQWVRTLLG